MQRFIAEHLVFNEAPKLIRQLQNPQTAPRNIQQGLQKGLAQSIKIGLDVLAGGTLERPAAITMGRPVTNSSVPTAHRARVVVYAPDLDGRADPGEIVWTWVVYEDDPSRGKDRPVLVVGRDRQTLLGLMLSSQNYHDRESVGSESEAAVGITRAVPVGCASIASSTSQRRASAARARSWTATRSRSWRGGCAPNTPGASGAPATWRRGSAHPAA